MTLAMPLGLTPYLYYSDLPTAIDWLVRVLGFVEKGRWQNDTGAVTNAEMMAGTTEIWLDGTPNWWEKKGRKPEDWIGVWVSDLDAALQRIVAAGVAVTPPQAKFYGVRLVQVIDPEGYTWGIMQRTAFVARAPIK